MKFIALATSNIFGLVLQLCLPFLLPPDSYSYYSLAIAASQIFILFMFEWLRLTTLRHATVLDTHGALLNIGQVKSLYLVTCYLTGAITLVCSYYFDSPNGSFNEFILLTVFIATSQSLFEGLQAISRATGRERAFANAWIGRSSLTLFICLACAYAFHSAIEVLIGYALSFLFALIAFHGEYIRGKPPTFPNKHSLKLALKYGMPLAISSAISIAVLPAIKGIISVNETPATSGSIFFVTDILQKIFMLLGMTISLALSQRIIQHLRSGESTLAIRLSTDMNGAAYSYILLGAGFTLILKDLILLKTLPSTYQSIELSNNFILLVLLCALIAIKSFSYDALCIVNGMSKPIVISSVVALSPSILFWIYPTVGTQATLIVFLISIALAIAYLQASLLSVIQVKRQVRHISLSIVISAAGYVFIELAGILTLSTTMSFLALILIGSCAAGLTSIYFYRRVIE